MKTVALISGGKDSCYNMMQCVAEGHEIVALANLKPRNTDEMDSYMYQSVGHHAIELYAEAMDLPLYRREITGSSKSTGKDYTQTQEDEVEDLFELLQEVKKEVHIEAVSVGAILSNYQRVRVENVCARLGLTPLAYLWRRDQKELLEEMIQGHVTAILIKVAALGLNPRKHLGKTLLEMQSYLLEKSSEYDLNVCGEGGEYETFTLDCPLFRRKIIIDKSQLVIHSDDAFAPVGYLNLLEAHLEDKPGMETVGGQCERVKDLPMMRSRTLLEDLGLGSEDLRCGRCEAQQRSGPRDSLTESLKPQVRLNGKHMWISGLTCCYDNGVDVGTLTRNLMDTLKVTLEGQGSQWDMSCIVLVHLYVNKMPDFAAINSVYRTYFGINPAARVCVEADLPENVALQLDCYGYCCHGDRDTMHVQGLSHWAPANIGPYSQCVKINNRLYVAGQIGMVPSSLAIVEGGIQSEARLSLRHAGRVLEAMATKCTLENVIKCVCYVTHREYLDIAKQEFQLTREKDSSSIPCCPVYVVVPSLPKGALVEWQVVADCDAAFNCNTKMHSSRRQSGDLECCVTGRMREEDTEAQGDTGGPSICCITGTVCRVRSYSSSEEVSERSVASMVVDCLETLVSETGQSLDMLSLMRVFYASSVFTYEKLYQEMSSRGLLITLVPVTSLETEDTLLSMVC